MQVSIRGLEQNMREIKAYIAREHDSINQVRLTSDTALALQHTEDVLGAIAAIAIAAFVIHLPLHLLEQSGWPTSQGHS